MQYFHAAAFASAVAVATVAVAVALAVGTNPLHKSQQSKQIKI